MNNLESRKVQCPYCGETIEVLIDCSVPDQHYIEDCQVCCQPIDFFVTVHGDGELTVMLSPENG